MKGLGSEAGLFTGRFLDLVGPDFPSTRLGQDFVRARLGADQVGGLLTWSALNHILSTTPLSAPRLRLFRDGAQVPVTRYTRGDNPLDHHPDRPVLLPEALYQELRCGASMVLDSIDQLHPPIAAAADDLMRLVHELVQVNLYVVWGESQGFDTHWDDHDTVIVQLVQPFRRALAERPGQHPLPHVLGPRPGVLDQQQGGEPGGGTGRPLTQLAG